MALRLYTRFLVRHILIIDIYIFLILKCILSTITATMNPYQKAKIYTFYLPNVEGVVYIHGSIQPPVSRSISSLNQKRVAYLNRVQIDEKKRSPRLDDLAQIFAGEEYRYDVMDYPCTSRKALYRK